MLERQAVVGPAGLTFKRKLSLDKYLFSGQTALFPSPYWRGTATALLLLTSALRARHNCAGGVEGATLLLLGGVARHPWKSASALLPPSLASRVQHGGFDGVESAAFPLSLVARCSGGANPPVLGLEGAARRRGWRRGH